MFGKIKAVMIEFLKFKNLEKNEENERREIATGNVLFAGVLVTSAYNIFDTPVRITAMTAFITLLIYLANYSFRIRHGYWAWRGK